jgi:MFS family permease
MPDTTTLSMIVASFLLASWLGCCIVASPWSDRIGRRIWILAGNAIQIVGTIICVASYSPGQMIAGRVVIVSDPIVLTIYFTYLTAFW